eukprot:NODE_761_length_4440_cov_0.463257.p1 type:complete len:655 gc:universal NODE_761_length_4440_cov_0.463257:254-2218(+)
MIENFDLVSELKLWDEDITVFELLDGYKGADFLKLITRLARKIIEKSKEFTGNSDYIESCYVNIKEDADIETLASDIIYFVGSVLLMPMSNQQAQALISNFIITTEKGEILNIIKFLLSNKDSHVRNAYLGAFLVPLNIPPEFQSLQAMQQLKTQLHEKREEFIELHKQVTAVQSEYDSLVVKEQSAIAKEEEKRILHQQVKSLDSKIPKNSQSDQWISVCKSFYSEQCLMNECKTKLQDVNQQILDFENKQEQYEYQKSELHDKLSGTSEAILQTLNEDLRKSNYIHQSQKEDVENNTKILTVLQQALSKTITRVDNLTMEDNIAKINSDLNTATQNLISKENSGASLLENQLNLLNNKKLQLQEKLFNINGSFPQLQQQNNTGTSKLLRSEFVSKKNELSELTNLKNGLLEKLQESRDKYNLRLEEMDKIEIQGNVRGFTKMRDEISKLSNKKSKLDNAKMETLEEMSKLVNEINAKIIDKKAIIQPKSSQLKKLRVKINKQEEIINEKQFAYDAKVSNIKKEVLELNSTNSEMINKIQEIENRKEELEDLLLVAKEHVDLLRDEKKKNSSKSEESLSTIREMLKRKNFELETKLKTAIDMENSVKEFIKPNNEQLESYKALTRLLELRFAENATKISKSDDANGTENIMII